MAKKPSGYKQGLKDCKKVGTSRASGDALRAMYASLIPFQHCLNECTAEKFFTHLQKFDTDEQISEEARRIIRSPDSVFKIIW